MAVEHTLALKQPWVVFGIGVKMHNRDLRVFSTNHESVTHFLVIFDTTATVQSFWFNGFWMSEVIVLDDKLLGGERSYV